MSTENFSSNSNISQTLTDIHYLLCDDASPQKMERAAFTIRAFLTSNLISENEALIRILALSSCPGHLDGRSWCAYCGNVSEQDT